MASLAAHPSAEPDTLVVRATFEDRDLMLADAPATYYITDDYRPHPVVLVRLTSIDSETIRELLAMSWRLTMPKTVRSRVPLHHTARIPARARPRAR
jgi:hypothetical protein